MSRLMVVLAVMWATGFGLWVAFGPVYYSTADSVACFPSPCSPGPAAHAPSSPAPHVKDETSSGLAVNGPILLLVLGVPVVLGAAPLFVSRARQRTVAGIAAILTVAFVLFAVVSVGLFYVPSATALAIAAVWPARRVVPLERRPFEGELK